MKQFTMKDLYGEYDHPGELLPTLPITCSYCGLLVGLPQRHRQWHNAVIQDW